MRPLPLADIVLQQTLYDCLPAALATTLSWSYERPRHVLESHTSEYGFSTRQPHVLAKSGEHVVFTVKGIDPSGRAMTFACGTDEQAMERTWELRRRGFRDVVVVDHKGKELGDAAFEQSLEIDWQ